MTSSLTSIAAFDTVARGYDRAFTDTRLARELRSVVWSRLVTLFPAESHVLELNCGTGEDAAFLASRGYRVTATDGSAAMIDEARRKAESRGVDSRIRFSTLDLADPRRLFGAGSFDGAFSNFGGLNCISDPGALAVVLGRWLRPEAPLVLVVMGPLCLWETALALAGGSFRHAFRRLPHSHRPRLARVGGVEIPIVYPWPSALARAFAPSFRLQSVEGLGVALPPSSLGSALERRPRTLRLLAACERAARTRRPFRILGDHYIAVLRRNG